MIAHATSKYKVVENLSDIPVIGGFIVAIFSALPGLFLVLYSELISPISDETFVIIAPSLFATWCYILEKLGIKLFIIFIPAWVFWFGLALLKAFGIDF